MMSCLSLLLALNAKTSLETVQLIVEVWPAAICEKDRQGYLLLHYACINECSHAAIQFLVEHWPMSVTMRTEDDNLPLHLVVNAKIMENVQLIVEAWPDAIREKDGWGYLLLHCTCCSFRCSDDVIQFLVECWPMSYIKMEGNILPLHLALQHQVSLKAI